MPESSHLRVERLYLKKIKDRIREIGERFLYTPTFPIEDVSAADTKEHLTLAQAKRLRFVPVGGGHRWGENWGTTWFRLRIRVPAAFRGECTVLLFDLDKSECLIYRDGEPVQGLSWARKEYILLEKARGGERIELYIEAGANARLGAFDIRTMEQPRIAALNREVWDAYWDLSALYDIVDPTQYFDWTGKPYHLPDTGDPRRAQIIFALNEAVDLFDYGNPVRAALREQTRAVRRRLKPLYECPATASAQTFAAMGHAHIDVAWQWPLAETVRKTGRTFANVLELMGRYPELIFAQSQPQLYEYARDRYPSLFRRVRAMAKKGRWIPTGCMWIEPDCNITGGESLVRQILIGTRFFKAEFGFDVATCWLPDVFGFSAALPQILLRSGIRYFFTTKIAINQFTCFPYHTFHWEGTDGSRVLAHFMPAEEYSSQVEPWLIRTGEREYVEKDRCPIQILPYGHGDGGGGPAPAHMERLRRYQDLEGMPRVTPMTPRAFFERLERESHDLPTWVGELYLELHRGTYTTQALTKKHNRQAEFMLRETEMLAALNVATGAPYAQRRFHEAWKLVLLNQFHDILPGSSIDEVYDESERQYAQVFDETAAVREAALEHLAAHVEVPAQGTPILAFNSLSWERRSVATFEPRGLRKGGAYVAVDAKGHEAPVQLGEDGRARFIATIPSIGHEVFAVRRGSVAAATVQATARRMENERVRLTFDARGRLRSIYDKSGAREVLAPGETGNRLLLFEDKMATCGPAWDIDVFYKDKCLETDGQLQNVSVVETGPVRAVVRFVRCISKSRVTQDVVLWADSARIDFQTTIEWGDEKDVLLKVAFPVNIRSEKARYEIQFGSIERPTHWNYPQDMAKFEVPAQKWADLSEGDYGVALLNDCKYGYDVKGNVLRLTLLRAPKWPGKTADVNQTHHLAYAIFPHAGSFANGVVRAGYELNTPVLTKPLGKRSRAQRTLLPASMSQMSITGENVIIETIKKAEDDDGIIVRLYEAHGSRGRNTIETALPVARAFETDLMEHHERELTVRNGSIALSFKPFEIKTVKLLLRKQRKGAR
ncbi:MAG: alpha-mannosidase [Candidatus Hydrogenedentes bacterium]|nr:alpha-mannosidase [Candidatus Hydrogenedentota bacterium]